MYGNNYIQFDLQKLQFQTINTSIPVYISFIKHFYKIKL